MTEFFSPLRQNMPNSIGMTKAAAKHNKAKEEFLCRIIHTGSDTVVYLHLCSWKYVCHVSLLRHGDDF